MPLIDPLTSVFSALESASLTPSPIPAFNPSALLQITWPSGAEVMLGNRIDAASMNEEPRVEIFPLDVPALEVNKRESADEHRANETETTYTLVMCDPDAPSKDDPKFGPFRHWVIAGLKAPAPSISQVAPQTALASQPAVCSYRAPAPGAGTGEHRYVFMLYEEPSAGIHVAQDAPERGEEKEVRRSWDPSAFAKTYGLKLISANFFTCQVDV